MAQDNFVDARDFDTVMAQNGFVTACERSDLAQVKLRLAADGVHVNCVHSWKECTGLQSACVQGHLAVVRWLVEDAFADIHVTDRYGDSPFWSACYCGRLEVAKYLVTRGSVARMPNRSKQTPFWAACSNGHLKVVRWLAMDVGVGNDVTRAPFADSGTSATPLTIANRYGGGVVVSWLAPFLLRRVLIAYWSVGRDHYRKSLPDLGCAPESAAWYRLPREAMADVLLLLASL